MADVLTDILSARQNQLEKAKANIGLSELEGRIKNRSFTKGFSEFLTKSNGISIIAEMKKKSPSAGMIREPYDVSEISKQYERGGASAVSVLTESERFGGDISDIEQVRQACSLPILRKDFIFDPYQVVEARAFGADAILLIADMLEPTQLNELVDCAKKNNLDTLVEVFTAERVPEALNSGSKLIGINTRNLRTLEMKPDNIAYISKLIPRDRIIVAESGFKTSEDVKNIEGFNISALLVGESLLKQIDLASAVQNLVQAGQQ